jgi:hypothetical protein
MVQICRNCRKMGSPSNGEMEIKYEQPPDFCRSDLLEVVPMVLTSMKAALFTAIVTAFVLDSMSDLDKVSQSDQPSSILTVNTLWFLSIISSLAATTWAILCLEWCAFLTEGTPAEDYEEMAEKRQRKFEAMERWKMRLIIAAIPLFLHTSLFLFLAGLWLRLRDINKQLGLIVGVSSLALASSYVTVTLLPIFTNAPFSTSASEIIGPVVKGIGHLFQLRRFVRPPRVFTWIADLPPAGNSPRALIPSKLSPYIPNVQPHQFSSFAGNVYKVFELYIYTAWKTVALLPVVPTFVFDPNPLDELNKFKVGNLKRDKRIHLRALFWLMNTPLSKDEVKEILKEFKNRGGSAGEPLDRTIIRLLVLSLSSILDNNHVSEDEQPIFEHCTEVLAEEMERAFEKGEHNRRVLFRNATVFGKLLPHFRLTPSAEDAPHLSPTTSEQEDYWSRAIPALWLCPTKKTVADVVSRLDSAIRSVKAPRLQRIVRGLHAAILVCSDCNQSTIEEIPDFSLWDWDYRSSNKDLDKTLASFLQDLFAAFYSTRPRIGLPTTTPSLVVDCLEVLDGQPEQYSPKIHAALCFFAVVMWRNDPKAFGEGHLLARALLASAQHCQEHNGEESDRAKLLCARLRAIAYGPEPSISKQSCSLKYLGDLYTGLPESIKTDAEFLKNLLDAHAAILEATLAADGHFAIFSWTRSPDCEASRNLLTSSWFKLPSNPTPNSDRGDPNCRLPNLYSLAITLTYSTEGRDQELWKVADLFVTRDEQERITVDRALDTNIIVVAILKFAISNQPEAEEGGRKEAFIKLLAEVVMHGNDWRTRWKSIYLAAGIAYLLSQMDPRNGMAQQAPFLIKSANENFEQVKLQRVPSDWGKKKKGLKLCMMESAVKSLASTRGEAEEGVYSSWSSRETVPYLALYKPRQITPEPISQAAYWAVRVFQLQR